MIALNYRGDEPARQHQALLECALARDAARAKSVLFEHVTRCVAHALATGTIR
jgi:DNA-binding GntR family transcriptional regulator